MVGTLYFVHGTGVREGFSETLKLFCDRAKAAGLIDVAITGDPWGTDVGAPQMNVLAALPPQPKTRAAFDEEATSAQLDVAAWALLIDDPLLELRLAGEMTADTGIAIGVQPPASLVQARMAKFSADTVDLDGTGVTAAELTAAVAAVAIAEPLATAVDAIGSADDGDLWDAVARAVVATILDDNRTIPGSQLPAIAIDGPMRDRLVDALADALAGTARGQVTRVLRKRLLSIGTGIATGQLVKHRAAWMEPAMNFIGDVIFYERRGEHVRAYLAERIGKLEPPVVVVAHSLGGIAMVDLLSLPNPPRVDLLVTVGSQSPVLYGIDGLAALRPSGDGTPPTPWLNIYNRQDLLSFCAKGVFPGVENITDEEVDAGVPFPESHSAYWRVPRTFELIRRNWPKLPVLRGQ
ncbi:MAG TPA: hypothetical protein VGM75_33500 [Pseudonocardiaceae bacterium]|jgi:hypothetical protein